MTNRQLEQIVPARGQEHRLHPRPHAFRRRALLRAALGAAGVAALAACGGVAPAPTAVPTAAPTPGAARTPPAPNGPAGGTATATPAGAGAETPAPARATVATAGAAGVDGRIPGGAPGVPDAFLKAPPIFTSVKAVPGRGGKVTTFQISFSAPPRARAENRYWQELEKRLGVTIEPTFTPAGTYAEKIAAVTAGGDLADLTWVGLLNAPGQNLPIQQGAYADLTPYLTGDALKEFPNLAAFPPQLWKNAAIKGKIYGVPRPMLTPGDPLAFRQDWADKVGLPQPKNAEEFLQLMLAFTRNDPDGNGKADTYGMAGATTIAGSNFNLAFFTQVFRVPHQWRRNPDGTLTNAIETEEFRRTIAFQRRLFEAEIFHPDSATLTNAQRQDNFLAGKFGSFGSNLLIYGPTGLRARLKQANPGGEAAIMLPFGHDGGRGVAHSGLGYFGFVCLPAKAGRDRERVKELLRILDYYAAPFGSEEQIFLQYGIEGVHHQLKPDSSRVRTEAYGNDAGDFPNLTNGPVFLYYPDAPDDALVVQRLVGELIAIGIENPALTAYSPTEATKAGELNQLRIDRLNAIITAREPLDALDTFIRDWRSRGGDQIRRELQDDLKA